MEFVVGSIIVAAAFIFISKAPLAIAMGKAKGGYDNHNPRLQAAGLTGFGARARALHENSIEAFPLFAAGALLALGSDADEGTLKMLCSAWIISRVLYSVCYLLDKDKLRSLIWGVGTACSFALMAQPLV